MRAPDGAEEGNWSVATNDHNGAGSGAARMKYASLFDFTG